VSATATQGSPRPDPVRVMSPGLRRSAAEQRTLAALSAFFLPTAPGQRFCVLHTPPDGREPRFAIVYLHAFAEEMNKSRRMAALQARRLAAEGAAVLHVDLFGCGDSSGEFGEARWDIWRRDVRAAAGWLSQRYRVPLTLWGLRLGAALAAEAAQDASLGVDRLLLWQPITHGGHFLSQFLRLRVASEMLTSGAANTAVRELVEALRRGEAPEIVGYELNATLASAIEQLNLEQLRPLARRVDWLEVAGDRNLPIRPASRRVLEAWEGAGLRIDSTQAVGDSFWSTMDITECPELLELTMEAFRRGA
jgi:exosortase A-associated hydrolase 2